MSITCCPLSNEDGTAAAVFSKSTVKATKNHRCLECGETIPKGSKYERVKGVWDGSWSTFKTCLSCVEIREHFACETGWVYGEVWQQLEENFFPDMKAGGPCMEGLSPEAKERLFTRRMRWLDEI